MRDRIPGAPGQYAAVIDQAQLQKLQNAEQFIITLRRDDQPLVEGTPYSKAAVLPDAVAAQLCPQVDDPTPADAFETVAQHIHSGSNPHAVTAAQVGALPVDGGTMKGAINMDSKKITNLATPTANNDAAHKKYVDDNVGEAVILSQGKSGDWYYRKWSDGFMECWRIISGTLNADHAWGSVYCSSVYDGRYKTVSSWYPDKFISEPTVILTPGPVSVGTCWIATNGTSGVDKLAQSPLFQIVRGTPKTDCDFDVHIYACGKYQ